MEHYIVWGFPRIDSATVKYDTGAVELDDLMFRRMKIPPGELETIYGWASWLAYQYALDQ